MASDTFRPVAGSCTRVKYAPGERTNWLTTTRSAPLITNVPEGVIIGMLHRNSGCSFTSPVSFTSNSTATCSGASKEVSFARHSSSDGRGSQTCRGYAIQEQAGSDSPVGQM